jgi:hypothetical protein
VMFIRILFQLRPEKGEKHDQIIKKKKRKEKKERPIIIINCDKRLRRK